MSEQEAPSLPKVMPAIFPGPPSWATVFGRRAPLEVELGCGRPHYLFERAAEAPEVDVVGIEWKARWIVNANKRMRREGVTNVRALHGNAWLLFGALFQPGSLAAVHLNFPDPWWKARHKKRRILNDTFADLVSSRLAPGGMFFIQTDVASLLEEILERAESAPSLTNPYGAGRLCLKKPVGARTHREKKCSTIGVPIFRAVLLKESA